MNVPESIARANARRLDLVEKKYKGDGLSADEQAELDACARVVGDWAFRPDRLAERREVLDEFAGWVGEMKRKVAARRAGAKGRDAEARKPLDL